VISFLSLFKGFLHLLKETPLINLALYSCFPCQCGLGECGWRDLDNFCLYCLFLWPSQAEEIGYSSRTEEDSWRQSVVWRSTAKKGLKKIMCQLWLNWTTLGAPSSVEYAMVSESWWTGVSCDLNSLSFTFTQVIMVSCFKRLLQVSSYNNGLLLHVLLSMPPWAHEKWPRVMSLLQNHFWSIRNWTGFLFGVLKSCAR
jgi:hypothetical protein